MSTETKTTETCQGPCRKTWTPSFVGDCYEIDGFKMCDRCAMPYILKTRMPETIDSQHVDTVCKIGEGEATCAFLLVGGPNFSCAKYTQHEETPRNRVEEGSMGAKRDNCSGPPAFIIDFLFLDFLGI